MIIIGWYVSLVDHHSFKRADSLGATSIDEMSMSPRPYVTLPPRFMPRTLFLVLDGAPSDRVSKSQDVRMVRMEDRPAVVKLLR